MCFKAVRHRIKVVIAYPTDEALGLEDKGRQQNVREGPGEQRIKTKSTGIWNYYLSTAPIPPGGRTAHTIQKVQETYQKLTGHRKLARIRKLRELQAQQTLPLC